ncbi:MAG: hypothetical protein EA353_06110 [Puniceicoccaceae bacterium]|nr:MAG: hypothetical protein EA353_06110 [Puniceicoccaceae bacterium]
MLHALSPPIPFSVFEACIAAQPDGYVLLEGRRNIPADFAARAEALARHLATHFPKLRFRSGNATGSDEAFAKGVLAVDPRRLHVVAPYKTHRKRYRHADAHYDSPDTLMTLAEDALRLPKFLGHLADGVSRSPHSVIKH